MSSTDDLESEPAILVRKETANKKGRRIRADLRETHNTPVSYRRGLPFAAGVLCFAMIRAISESS